MRGVWEETEESFVGQGVTNPFMLISVYKGDLEELITKYKLRYVGSYLRIKELKSLAQECSWGAAF